MPRPSPTISNVPPRSWPRRSEPHEQALARLREIAGRPGLTLAEWQQPLCADAAPQAGPPVQPSRVPTSTGCYFANGCRPVTAIWSASILAGGSGRAGGCSCWKISAVRWLLASWSASNGRPAAFSNRNCPTTPNASPFPSLPVPPQPPDSTALPVNEEGDESGYFHIYEMGVDGGDCLASSPAGLRRHDALLSARRRPRLRLDAAAGLFAVLRRPTSASGGTRSRCTA